MNELKSKLENDVTNLMHLEMDAEIPLIDGIMFYHRETPYINATTPLVGWLKPEHISEQFENIKTHPVSFTNFLYFTNHAKTKI